MAADLTALAVVVAANVVAPGAGTLAVSPFIGGLVGGGAKYYAGHSYAGRAGIDYSRDQATRNFVTGGIGGFATGLSFVGARILAGGVLARTLRFKPTGAASYFSLKGATYGS